MPSVKGKGSGGDMRARAARNGKRVGRPAKHWIIPIEPDKVAIVLSAESAALAQRLMLHFPGCCDIAALYELALRRLAETRSMEEEHHQ